MRKQTVYPAMFMREDYRVDPPEELEKKINSLIEAMTAEEKFSLLAGQQEPDQWGKIGNAGYQWGVPRLGIPEAVMYDGPAGVTGIVETTGLPQPSLLGCTWDEDMAYAFGQVAASENAACAGNYQLAPQVDTIHSPHFARNKDMKSEDSFLVARLAAAETKGIQDQHVVATVKHLSVANSMPGFFSKVSQNVIVDEQTLHETYLRPFEEAVKYADAGSIMNSYNCVNGHFSTDNREINVGILRDQWGFKGSVMSDWGSVHNFTLNRGMDIEMPSPAFNDVNRIIKNLQRGKISMDDIDCAAKHVLYGMARAGLLSLVKLDEDGKVMEDRNHPLPIRMEWRYEEAVQSGLLEKNQEIAKTILKEGTVLLKNEGVLPLKNVDNTVLIGLGSLYPVCGEMQERGYGRLLRMKSGQEALEDVTGIKIPAYVGDDYVGEPIPPEVLFLDAECSKNGVKRTAGIRPCDWMIDRQEEGPGGMGAALNSFAVFDEDGEIVNIGFGGSSIPNEDETSGEEICDANIDFTTGIRAYTNGESGRAFSSGAWTWKTYLRAPESGLYKLKLESIGGDARFLICIDGKWKEIASATTREGTQWPWDNVTCTPTGMGVIGEEVELIKGNVYPMIVMARHTVVKKDLQVRAAWVTRSMAEKNWREAIAAASKADQVIFFAVNRGDYNPIRGMYADRSQIPDISLVENQKTLLQNVAQAMRTDAKLIVVLQTSNAIACGDIEEYADAMITSYMGGQEACTVLAEILMGKINPSGKLTQTWPKNSADTPLSDSMEHYKEREFGVPLEDEIRIQLTEGIFFGYRWYDKSKVEPLFAFGHGLSYTSYAYSNLDIQREGNCFIASFDVTNTGKVAGDEIVQLYLGKAAVPAYVQMAEKQLAGFVRVKNLQPNETRRVCITVDERALYYWDIAWNLQSRADGTKDKWHLATGRRELIIGASSSDIRLRTFIEV